VRPLDGTRARAAAVAVSGDRVLAVGDLRSVRAAAGPRAERIDCGGATVLPGLIDPHLHLLALAAAPAQVDCGALDDVAQVLAAVGVRARRTPPGTWIRGGGLDDRRLGRLPTRAELDRVAPRHPVRRRHRSRHASVLNTRGLERLRRASTDGLVHGAEAAVSRAVGSLPADTIDAGLRETSAMLAAQGITTVADATPRTWAQLAPLRRALDAGAFRLRVHAMRPTAGRRWPAHDRLAAGPVKILVDEGPYGMRPSASAMARRIAEAAARGAQVAVHCVGGATLVAALAAFAALPRALRAGRRHRLEHLAECAPPLIGRVARLGLTVVTNPSFVALRGDVYRRETPRDAWPWLYRARSLLAAGVVVAAGSDAPVSAVSPWLGIAAARRRRTPSGAVLGPAERLDAASALALYTRAAAHALHADGAGRLAVGGPADLIVVSSDPLRVAADEVADTTVRLTMVGGEVVFAG
jgi:predicted amidohydrolase YtcJ